jgi:hypothetical protein
VSKRVGGAAGDMGQVVELLPGKWGRRRRKRRRMRRRRRRRRRRRKKWPEISLRRKIIHMRVWIRQST